ncbi:myb/SANT-like DNA-binding domain-containing protein 7 [Leuresthes tenuis]|uniref:myb/SANT-like DNA-binding domain-containing protein 7 n=1 Tax=Leuresthes tenuis TaxID=355514 RepID=UPI003B50F1A9
MENARSSAHFWTYEQTQFMLNQLKDLNILKFMDGRKTRNEYLFIKVAQKMEEAGFPRTPKQVRIRWKNVKKAYMCAKRDIGASGRRRRTLCPFFDLLDELLGSRPQSQAGHHGIDSGIARHAAETTVKLEETTFFEVPPGSYSPTRSTPASSPRPTSSTPLPAVTSDRPGRRVQHSRRRQRDIDVLVQGIWDMNRRWEGHMKRSEAREDRLIATILQSNASMVATLKEGMRNLGTNI